MSFAGKLISPVGLSLASYIVFTLSWIMPPGLYSSIVKEPNMMSFDARLWLFVTACTAAFALGSVFAPKMGKYIPAKGGPAKGVVELVIFMLCLAIALNIVSILIIISNSGNVIGRILSGGGGTAKATLNTEGALTEALPFLYGIVWWSIVRIEGLVDQDAALLRVAKFLIWGAIFIGIFVAILKLARFEIVPFLVGLFICFNRREFLGSKTSFRHLFSILALGPAAIIAVFFAFAALRGIQGIEQQISSFFGYGPASFNRLAVMLNGGLIYPFAGHGYYVAGFLTKLPLIQNVVDLGAALGLPSRVSAFLSEFSAVRNAGLNAQYIWSSTFGYFYADIGYWTIVFMAFIGFLVQGAWVSWRAGRALGLVMYPFLAGTVLLWGTTNLIVQPRLTTFVFTAVLVLIGEAFLGRRVNSARP